MSLMTATGGNSPAGNVGRLQQGTCMARRSSYMHAGQLLSSFSSSVACRAAAGCASGRSGALKGKHSAKQPQQQLAALGVYTTQDNWPRSHFNLDATRGLTKSEARPDWRPQKGDAASVLSSNDTNTLEHTSTAALAPPPKLKMGLVALIVWLKHHRRCVWRGGTRIHNHLLHWVACISDCAIAQCSWDICHHTQFSGAVPHQAMLGSSLVVARLCHSLRVTG